MARVSSQRDTEGLLRGDLSGTNANDPVEKFRFRVTVLSIDLSLSAAADAVGAAGSNPFGVLQRAGFSQINIPRVNVNSMKYRENIDNLRRTKIAGLADYAPVSLKRGVTHNRDLYDWYRLVNEDMALLATAQELSKDSIATPSQSLRYRKEVVIEVLDREGNPIKGWFLFNAWPSSYQGGDVLDAQDDSSKLIEDLTLEYEFFLEFEGGLAGFAKELIKNVAERGVEELFDLLPGSQNGVPFP